MEDVGVSSLWPPNIPPLPPTPGVSTRVSIFLWRDLSARCTEDTNMYILTEIGSYTCTSISCYPRAVSTKVKNARL